ncbi:MAG TPA: hypothetical protein P5230_03720 [Candidatus Magasanikbacteria bacterium]|nr:hypothetical protein [Candidatus Magasanikbacteria bacterium]
MFTIVISITGLYILSAILTKFKVYSLTTHRLIWNVALLVTFLVTAYTAIVWYLQFNSGVRGRSEIRGEHIEWGFAMITISFFHTLWHAKYFIQCIKNVFKKNATNCEIKN